MRLAHRPKLSVEVWLRHCAAALALDCTLPRFSTPLRPRIRRPPPRTPPLELVRVATRLVPDAPPDTAPLNNLAPSKKFPNVSNIFNFWGKRQNNF